MFGLFKKPEVDERERAIAAYEKAVSLTINTREAYSLRLRVGMLCNSHLDKTFVAGAEQTEAHEAACALAIAQGKAVPEPPVAPLFQFLNSSAGSVCVYLPKEHADEAFALGMLYQKTSITAEQSIDAMQRLSDRVCLEALKLTTPFVAVQFLREELAGEEPAEGEGDPA